jgi:UDP-glucose 4-epimerase
LKYLVTGGAGFIGSNLVRRLVEDAHQVAVVDNLATGSTTNLAEVEDSIDLEVGDVRDPDVIRKALKGKDVQVVFHLAALASVARSVANPVTTHGVNAEGTLNVLLAARDAEVRRVVYASSSSIYGDSPELPKVEKMAPSPISPYAASKLAGEAYCHAFSHSYELETVSLRFFNVFGPRQDPLSEYAAVVPRFISRMIDGLPPIVYGDGRQSRDFTYISNVVDACISAAEAPSDVSGEVFNVGCGGSTTLLELLAMLSEIFHSEPGIEFTDARKGDVLHSQASIDKARRLLGYAPTVSVQEGLAETVKWFATRKEPVPTSNRS